MIHSQLDSTITIGMIAMVVVFVIGMLITSFFSLTSEQGDRAISLVIGSVLTALATGIGVFLIWFPFGYAYNHYVPVSGIVTAVGSRFIGDANGGTTQRYLVQINGRPYGCDDTRCSTLHKGMTVTLLCEKEFQFNAPQEGYACNYGMLGLNR